jgi:DNA polymerase III sliding clamp (beta) subunit (PCNA family)
MKFNPIQINLRALKAVAMFSSSEEARYYLRGVHIEFSQSQIIMVATNGHYMSVVKQELPDGDGPGAVPSVIVPLEMIEKIKLGKKDSDFADFSVEENGQIRIAHNGSVHMMAPVDGTFPAWRVILPKTLSGETAQYNASYLALYHQAAAYLAAEKINQKLAPSLQYNGLDPALVDWIPGVANIAGFGVLMPFRPDAHAMKEIPAWAKA